jgi:diguanylate cyclase
MKLDWSARGRARTYAFTVLGTLACIAFAFAFDGFSFRTGEWRWGAEPINNLLIPLLIAPPFFFLLLNKMRQLAIAHHELLTVASTDGLTCVLNRRAFTEIVEGYLKRAGRASAPSNGALLVIDVDHFKAINDRFGHDSGDEALKLIASTISATVRETDLVGRMGGEEFCVFIPGRPTDDIRAVAERIRLAVNETRFVARGEPYHLSVSVGGVVFDDGVSFGDLYRGADERLYCAKREGRNRVELRPFSPAAPMQPMLH